MSKLLCPRGHGSASSAQIVVPAGQRQPLSGNQLAYTISAAQATSSNSANALRSGVGCAFTGSQRLDHHQHDDGRKQHDRHLVEDAKPALAALVAHGFEALEQRTARMLVPN